MVFKRRERPGILRQLWETVYPRGGWSRAFYYIQHRMRRLPDSPERVARGVAVGVFTSFTPFYGIHFFIALALARIVRGNYFASLVGTFFGNPLTYVPIGVIALKSGYWILGDHIDHQTERSLGGKFADAATALWKNLSALFTSRDADWGNLRIFYDEIFFPYMIGGIVPGIIAALICYAITVPVIRAYQKRRKGALKARFAALRDKARDAAREKP